MVEEKQSFFKSHKELPLFLNAKTVAQVLGISMGGTYELLHQKDFPVLKIGSQFDDKKFYICAVIDLFA